jgi:hypothetical protein
VRSTPPVVRLTRAGRAARTTATLVAAALLTAGTMWGQDDAFPFGPFRMYATSTGTTGAISVPVIQARTADGPWRPVPLTPRAVGMNQAEVEGQLPRIVADPSLLGRVAAAHARLHPDAEPWTAVRLARRATVVTDRVPTGEVRETILAEWTW